MLTLENHIWDAKISHIMLSEPEGSTAATQIHEFDPPPTIKTCLRTSKCYLQPPNLTLTKRYPHQNLHALLVSPIPDPNHIDVTYISV